MGMCAEILAIGRYTKAISKYLEYSQEYYANTKNGAPIVEHLFGIIEGSAQSREFAKLLGINDP